MLAEIMTRTLRTVDDSKPWVGTWESHLETVPVRGRSANGVVWHGDTNGNFIVLPNGIVIKNYGSWGGVAFDRCCEDWRAYLREHIERHNVGAAMLGLDKLMSAEEFLNSE